MEIDKENKQNEMTDEDNIRAKDQAEEVKAQGNEEFKKGNYTRAIELYGRAISLNDKEPSYYNNRATCYYKLKKCVLPTCP